ncbi:SSU ribosomal protein S6p [hydrothermal vent metagenome]|uniref:SSU ribosomal protein S6p n=1 Tax=hydrothermal vent metagenome TaxID=652676 RepID=A0A1W1CK42_9ZZZZ
MRHYEIVLVIHPGQSAQVPVMVDKYKELIQKDGGQVHRLEDWGRKHLAYPIKNMYKAHYIMMNIECSQEALNQLTYNFRFNDAILRNLVVSKREAITEESVMMIKTENKKKA